MPPRTVSTESLNEMATTFRNGYSVMTRTPVTNTYTNTSNSRSVKDVEWLLRLMRAPPYMMLSLVTRLKMPFAVNSRMTLTTELKMLIAVPNENRPMPRP